jgi:hypothetical protein
VVWPISMIFAVFQTLRSIRNWRNHLPNSSLCIRCKTGRQIGAVMGLPSTFIVMSLIGLAGVVLALWLWPASDPSDVVHDHPSLPPDHPHLRTHADRGKHHHQLIVDDLHRIWPKG